jgi:transmembrane 9 superfamily protein 2/4
MPAAENIVDSTTGIDYVFYEHGYHLGGKFSSSSSASKPKAGKATQTAEEAMEASSNYYINNHVRITVLLHRSKEFKGSRVVGVQVSPLSIEHTYEGELGKRIEPKDACADPASQNRKLMVISGPDARSKLEKEGEKLEVVFTYDVEWERSPIKWASRWDIYLSMGNRYSDEVHWFSIINSVLIAVFLTGMVALILMRTLRKDLVFYNRVMTDEEKQEQQDESGWKLVHGQVFRPPSCPMLFSVFVGTGTQVALSAFVTLIFACIGFLSPANRGALMIVLVLLFVFMGVPGGYTAARTYKMLGETSWQKTIVLQSTLFPVFIFAIFFGLNLIVWHAGSTGAVPFGAMFTVIALWFGISIPLTFIGAYFGYRRPKVEHPLKIDAGPPKSIPPQPWYMSPCVTIPIGGILPFGAVFVEIFFIFSALWLDQYYYVFGFTAIVFVIMLITCAEIVMVLIYFQLCSEDYRWWWRSFLTAGSSAMYVGLYAVYYFATKMHVARLASAITYFGYMSIVCSAFFMITGVVGYCAGFWFTRKIYGSLKVD